MRDPYNELRRREGWADASGAEHPRLGGPWRRRLRVARRAVSGLDGCRLVLDAGAGGGWLAELLPLAVVIFADLRPPGGPGPKLRADLRRLPLAAASVDAVVFGASLHHVETAPALSEAGRVTRPGGRLVVFDSPVYAGAEARDAAILRSREYFRRMGVPELAHDYHPIVEAELLAALRDSGYEDVHLSRGWLHRHLAGVTARRR